MSELVLVDTDILIDAGRGISDAIACLEQLEQNTNLGISVITQMELMVGCRDKIEMRALDKFLSRFEIVQLSNQATETAVDLMRRYRLSHGLLIADALIAATAISLNVGFVTKNQSDYRFITGLHLLSYPVPMLDDEIDS